MRLNFHIFLISLLVLSTWLLCVSGWEVEVSGWFFDSASGKFPLVDREPCSSIDWLCLICMIGVLLSAGAAILCGFTRPERRECWVNGFFLLAVFLLGPGLAINGGLKLLWGRPRPIHLQEFGGEEAYRPAWSPGPDPLIHRSFPSGDASAAFFFLVPAFFLRAGYARRLLISGGIALCLLVTFSRIAQGRHFLTDVIWSAAIVFYSAILLRTLFQRYENSRESSPVS